MTSAFRFRTAAVTHEGHVRTANEDSHLVRELSGLWVVADGMGGHQNGQWASQTVVQGLAAAPLAGGFDGDSRMVADAIHQANGAICQAATAAGKTMGSTAVVLLIAEGRFVAFWVGDSRIYLLRGDHLFPLTRDHTQVQDMVERGLLAPEEARGHPMSNVLSRAVGVQTDLQIDAVADEVRPRDVFLLCSDGLTGLVSEAEIEERLARFDPETATRRLLELVLSRGASDNVTIVAVSCEEMTAINFAAPA